MKDEIEKVWSTAQDEDIKMHGYVEVRSTMPVKVDGDNLEGSWPAIWMLGTGNGQDWPTHGEIDITEAINGDPEVTVLAKFCIFFPQIRSLFVLALHDTPLYQHVWSQWSAS